MAIAMQTSPPIHRKADASHEFSLGQAVRLKEGFRTVGVVYTITAKLPANNGSPQYRIRNDAESFERMAMQSSLELVTEADGAAAGPA